MKYKISVNKLIYRERLKIVTPKQMLQRLLSKTGNIRQNIFVLIKKITKKVYNNIMNSIKIIRQNGYCTYEFWKQ